VNAHPCAPLQTSAIGSVVNKPLFKQSELPVKDCGPVRFGTGRDQNIGYFSGPRTVRQEFGV